MRALAALPIQPAAGRAGEEPADYRLERADYQIRGLCFEREPLPSAQDGEPSPVRRADGGLAEGCGEKLEVPPEPVQVA